MLNREEKKAVVADLKARAESAEAAILADYRGLTVAEVNELRSRLRESGVYFRVVKNNLAMRAVQDTDKADLEGHFVGPTAMALSEDPVAAAKVLSEFANEHDDLEIKVGAMNGELLSTEQISELAQLPSREQLLTNLAVGLKAPITKMARSLNEVPGKFVRAVAAVRDQKQEQGDAA